MDYLNQVKMNRFVETEGNEMGKGNVMNHEPMNFWNFEWLYNPVVLYIKISFVFIFTEI